MWSKNFARRWVWFRNFFASVGGVVSKKISAPSAPKGKNSEKKIDFFVGKNRFFYMKKKIFWKIFSPAALFSVPAALSHLVCFAARPRDRIRGDNR